MVIRFGPDDRKLLTLTTGGAGVWDATRENKVLFEVPGPPSMRDGLFSSDRSCVLPSQIGMATLWDARTGARRLPMRDDTLGLREFSRDLSSPAIAFSHDGARIATGFRQSDRTLIWQIRHRMKTHATVPSDVSAQRLARTAGELTQLSNWHAASAIAIEGVFRKLCLLHD